MDWDASTYHQLSAPQVAWGQTILARLTLEGSETVLDAGCGTGRLTAALLDKVPHGRAVGLDFSEVMVTGARSFLRPQFGRRVQLVRANALHLPFRESFDLIFSTATFHWITDHSILFESLFVALKTGGRLEAQCGGGPNLARFLRHVAVVTRKPGFAPYFEGGVTIWEFANADTTTGRLLAAGFVDVDTSVEAAPVTLPDAVTFRNFVAAVIVRPHLERLPPSSRDAFLDAVVERCAADRPPFSLDYWRLNLRGRRP